jgi:sugar (glycoside-pentoside-hexuronide) transporter
MGQTNGAGRELPPLKLWQIAAYGSGDFGFALVIHMTGLYLLYFYTDVYGIPAAAAGTIFLIARFWDAVNDPLMGYISDRTRSRWGKYRPYLLFGALPLAVLNTLLWVTPGFSVQGKFIWALSIYICWGMVYTATNLPYGSLTAVYTQRPVERTSLAASRIFMGMPGILFIAVVTPMMVTRFDSERVGYPAAAAIFSVIALGLLWLVFGTVKERVDTQAAKPYGVKEMVELVFKNRPLMLVSSAVFLTGTANAVRVLMAKYYFDYNLANPKAYTWFMAILVATMMFGAACSAILNRWVSKRNLYITGTVLFAFAGIGMYFSPYHALGMILGFSAIVGVGSGMVFTLVWALVADTVEYGEWKTGKRAEGVTYASYSFFSKMASAAGGAMGGFILAASGYVPKAIQTPEADHAIRALFTIGPTFAGVAAVGVMFFYTLDAERFQEILDDLEERKRTQAGDV